MSYIVEHLIYFLKAFLINLFIYLLLRWSSLLCSGFSGGERGLLFVAVRRLLIAVATLVEKHGL